MLQAVILNGERIRPPLERDAALADHWSQQFRAVTVDTDSARRFILQYGRPLVQASDPPPLLGHAIWAISTAPNTSPGPDGRGYRAWDATRLLSVQIPHQCGQRLSIGFRAPLTFGDSMLHYPPKSRRHEENTNVLGCPRPPDRWH